jgi:shikimate dehydrogenase
MAAARWGITETADEHLMPVHKAACVIGWPVGHSRSPLIHNYWIKQHGLDAEYRREAVPTEQFKDFITHLAARGYVGANVTAPHKEAALAVSEPDERALAVGAANTLWLDGSRLRSTNTDVEGFIGNLDATAPGWDRSLQSALVVGAGGAARAVVFGLLERGIGRILLVNRTAERAAALRTQLGDRVMLARWSDLDGLMAEAGLLVNTTSLGMAGQPPLTIELARLPAGAVVSDLVYAPLETALLAAARSRGLCAVDGLGMLLHQAGGGFQRWFGVRPQVTEDLRALVEADLISK